MSDVKWIKIVTDIFDNKKIRMLEAMPEGDSIIVIWLKLLILAGNTNDNGYIYFTKDIPYTDQMLATIFNRPLITVQLALNTFQNYGMIEIVDDILRVSNWEKYQNIEGMERIREQTRKRVARYRESKKLALSSTDVTLHNVTETDGVTQSNAIDIDKDIDKDIEIEKDIEIDKDINNISNTNVLDCPTSSDKKTGKYVFVEETKLWNELEKLGIAPIRGITPNSERARHLKARFSQYGQESFKEIIDAVKQSDFLQGKHKGKPWQATFDWIILPRNYPKVLEGNYRNTTMRQYTGSQFDHIDIGE